jgi:PAS domain S-box-containing protein
MLIVPEQDSINAVVRAILEKSDRDIRVVNDAEFTEIPLSGDNILELFAAGIAADAPVKTLVEGDPALNPYIHWLISIFDSLHDGVLIADQHAIIRYINKSFERISGAVFSEVVGRYLLDARPGARLGEVIESGKPMLGIRRKMGNIEYLTDMHPLIINGVCMGGVTIARDITEVQQLQTKLSKYHAQYNDLLRQINSANVALYTFTDIFGDSASFRATKHLAEKLAKSSLPILLRGESGTGKELFAHAIHQASERSKNPFVVVNCAAIPDALLESELFGYVEGAFSGAKKGGKVGLISLANTGTLFLDEIGDLGVELQAKLLRVLQKSEVQPLGDVRKTTVDVRVIAATNAKLEPMISQGKFREDLFYRLNVSQIHIPPLRERKADIIPLANRFLANITHPIWGKLALDEKTLAILENHFWPGNVRELENTVRFIANITDRQVITPEYLPQIFLTEAANEPLAAKAPPTAGATLKARQNEQEREAIIAALAQYGRSVAGKKAAAQSLAISLTTLYSRMKYLQIE